MPNDDLELREPLKHARCKQPQHVQADGAVPPSAPAREVHLEPAVAEPGVERRVVRVRRALRVQVDGHVQGLRDGPHGVVRGRVVEGTVVEVVADEGAHEAEVLDTAAQLGCRRRRADHGEQGEAAEALGVLCDQGVGASCSCRRRRAEGVRGDVGGLGRRRRWRPCS